MGLASASHAQNQYKTEASFSFAGWSNAGPAVFALSNYVSTNSMLVRRREPPSNASPALLSRLTNQPAVIFRPISVRRGTNAHFDRFAPESLSHLVWTNFLARTNRQAALLGIADRRSRPPVFTWNTNCWIWGSRGLTACSPMNESETWPGNAPGQVAITALTRRHGYTRGHSMGGEASQGMVGAKVWFVTASNTLVTRIIKAQQTRVGGEPVRDYTVVLFDEDLPASIPPLRVAGTNVHARYPWRPDAPHPLAIIEQSKAAQAGLQPFNGLWSKGGDSGGPILIPLPGELIFIGGISTSGPGPAMQEDMDALSRRAGLDPAEYQMQHLDLSRWPAYEAGR